ncbi:MAG: carboxylesterase family protein [Bacteroidota bacterium]|uniref:Carboxylic ester hydrolase n=1 Tax=Flagellimonas profundi TaxID=2915620 RepID=A0ABS3FHF1_9FLAO|nr:carboxylesterase family protein [Allomuricauda profundi]MBO0342576.1 carboxylesterase family protein [Allomuricauda profundi]MEC7772690.1 carboxylesterase family protein [Bacteroidota bacterium]
MKKTILLLYVISICLGCAQNNVENQNVVATQNGKVEGYTDGEIQIFKGIPFAQPPVGELRWKSPQPVKDWEGVKECMEFGPSPIQNTPEPFLCWTEEFIAKPEPLSEDCLYLNVWTPAQKKDEKLPVFVWIYGGGLSSGSANCDIYDGKQMAEQGVVFVSLNYRVGVLGFMAHPELSEESGHNASGNYGFMDQLQGLKWIQENIAAFGGDPNNVTIAGQSAGSFSVNAQITSPLASGYFDKAICQSGGILGGRLMQDLNTAEGQGVKFMESANVSSIDELREVPATKLQELSNNPDVGRFGVVLDDYFLPKDLSGHFKEGNHNQVSVMTGWVTGDSNLLPTGEVTKESFSSMVQERFGPDADEFLKMFPAKTDQEALQSQQKMNLLSFAGVSSYLLAEYMDKEVWLYEFTHVPTDKPGFPNYGAFHTSEVPFALHTLDQWKRPWQTEERKLEDQMSAYWVNFAKNGNPNGQGLPEWPSYNNGGGELLTIDTDAMEMNTKYSEEFQFLSQD